MNDEPRWVARDAFTMMFMTPVVLVMTIITFLLFVVMPATIFSILWRGGVSPEEAAMVSLLLVGNAVVYSYSPGVMDIFSPRLGTEYGWLDVFEFIPWFFSQPVPQGTILVPIGALLYMVLL